MQSDWDVIVIGGGTAGLAAAIFASRRGGRVLVLEGSHQVGGTLHISSGRMSAAGTKLQAAKGITDTKEEFYEDVMRICRGTADPALVQLAIDHAAETFDWLTDVGMPILPQCPVTATGLHEAYRNKRYAWGPELGKSILKALEPQFWAEVMTGKVKILLKTKASSLIQDPVTKAVLGVRARGADGLETEHRGENVVLATGGFAASPSMVAELHGCPLYAHGAWPTSQGDGIRLGVAAGGYVRGGEYFHANFGVVLADYNYPSTVIGKVITQPELRGPWEIYLDSSGRRFVAEDEPSIDARERALVELPDRRYWVFFDQAILDEAPPVMENWSREQVSAALGNHPMFLKGDTLEELARNAGLELERLKATIEEYNSTFDGPDRFGRKHRPRRLGSKGPFYAIRQHITLIVSTAGLTTDGELRVVDPKGNPIPNLYAAGEVLGSVATMGDAAANGMLVTPALAFGRLLGNRILQWRQRRNAAA